jgi:hypothetical protein
MEALITLVIAWAGKKLLDAALSGIVKLSKFLGRKNPYSVYRKDYVSDLENKALSLTLLERAYAELVREDTFKISSDTENSKWRH